MRQRGEVRRRTVSPRRGRSPYSCAGETCESHGSWDAACHRGSSTRSSGRRSREGKQLAGAGRPVSRHCESSGPGCPTPVRLSAAQMAGTAPRSRSPTGSRQMTKCRSYMKTYPTKMQ